jgi:hypothetical protein
MKKKWAWTRVIIAACVLLAAGCEDAKTVLNKFLQARYSGDFVATWDNVSSADHAVKDVQRFLSDSVEGWTPLRQMVASKTSFQVKSVTADKTQAVAQVDVTGPDLAAITKDVFGGDPSASNSMTRAQVEGTVTKTYNGKMPIVTKTENYRLVKEPGGWKVYMDWKKDTQLDDLKAQALELEKNKEYTSAQGKWSEILVLDPNNQQASAKIAELDKKLAGYGEAQTYAMKIELSNATVETILGGKLAVFSEIKNAGDRKLQMVEVVIDFLDANKGVVAEKSFRPIAVSKGGSGQDDQPLKPGEKRKFGIRADDLPSTWNHSVLMRVNDLQFAE